MKAKEIIKRYIFFVIGLFFIGMGIAFTRHGELGVSPVSSVGNILSYKFTFLSLGQWLTVTNILFVIAQVAILRRKFKLFHLLQIPLSIVFGIFTDICLKYISSIPTNSYFMQLTMVFAGVIVLALGIAVTVTANVIMNTAEMLVKAISDTSGHDFGTVKIIFDISWVIVSVILSLIFFEFKIVGTREGTIIAAIFTGVIAKFFIKLLSPIDKYLKG